MREMHEALGGGLEEMTQKIQHRSHDLRVCAYCGWKTLFVCPLGQCLDCCRVNHFSDFPTGTRREAAQTGEDEG